MQNKIKIMSSITLIALILAGVGLILSAWADYGFAAGVTLTGDAEGLRLEPKDALFTEENMAPGHTSVAVVTARNEGKKRFNLTVSAQKTGGGDLLFNTLLVEIAGPDDHEYYSGSMSGIDKIGIGYILAGSARDLRFTVTFPREAGNELQDASLEMNWVFNAAWDSGGGGGGGGGEGSGSRGGDRVETFEPETPNVSPEEQELVINPEAPGVNTAMPGTGVDSPYLYYVFGALVLLSGAILIRKPRRR